MTAKEKLIEVLAEYRQLGIAEQIDYDKFYLYSLITHSTAIEGSTMTEIENQLLFDEGISAKGRTILEQLMNLDLKKAYSQGQNRFLYQYAEGALFDSHGEYRWHLQHATRLFRCVERRSASG